jgi:hypothetical protein
MILQDTEKAIQGLLQATITDAVGNKLQVPVYLSDADITKAPMPYVVIQCNSSEEQITPGSGIFKVSGTLAFRSHTKENTPGFRQKVLDAINNFAYDSTAAKLSQTAGFHCHGWQPTTGVISTDNDRKSTNYDMTYWVYCMSLDQLA